MRHYKREYSQGKVAPYERRGKTVWRGTITEYTVTEKNDERGVVAHRANGDVVLNRRRSGTPTKCFSDIPCSLRRDGSGKYTNETKAQAAFNAWRNSLLAKAEEDYQNALANDTGVSMFKYDQMLIPAYLDMHIDEIKADGAEPSTIDGYKHGTATIREFFKEKPLGELTENDLVSYDREYRSRGLSDTTRGKALRILKQAMKSHRKQIGCDPFADFTIPSQNSADPNPLNRESLGFVKDAVKKAEPTQFMCAVEIALRTGMRIGEICGLKWSNVEIDTGNIYVCNAIGRTNGGMTLYEKVPKTNKRKKGKPTRHIPGSPKIQAMFERRLECMVGEYMAAHPTTSSEEARAYVLEKCYVIGTVDGKYANPTVLGRTWRGYSQGLVGTKGRRPTFHDLRHTYATYAIAAGIDPVTVASILGHSDPSITMRIYADALPDVKVSAQSTMDSVF